MATATVNMVYYVVVVSVGCKRQSATNYVPRPSPLNYEKNEDIILVVIIYHIYNEVPHVVMLLFLRRPGRPKFHTPRQKWCLSVGPYFLPSFTAT